MNSNLTSNPLPTSSPLPTTSPRVAYSIGRCCNNKCTGSFLPFTPLFEVCRVLVDIQTDHTKTKLELTMCIACVKYMADLSLMVIPVLDGCGFIRENTGKLVIFGANENLYEFRLSQDILWDILKAQ